jgi:hypothetical protein
MSTAVVPNRQIVKRKRAYRDMFEDIRCDEWALAPKHLQAHLAALGGWTQYEKPFFRIARCETVWRKISIDFPIWREGDDPNFAIPIPQAITLMKELLAKKTPEDRIATEVQEFVEQHGEHLRPLRSDTGYRWVRKYQSPGIVIETWNPPDKYGEPAEWEAMKILGYSFCGPYPHQGDYELIGFEEETPEFWEGIVDASGQLFKKDRQLVKWPTKDRILHILEMYTRDLVNMPENPLTRTFLRIAEFEQRELARFKRVEEECEPYAQDLQRIFRSTRLSAGRLREKIVRQCRQNFGHVGN